MQDNTLQRILMKFFTRFGHGPRKGGIFVAHPFLFVNSGSFGILFFACR